MWYVFLWLNICSLTVHCQRAFDPYYTNYINSYLYPSIYLHHLSQSKQEYNNKVKRNVGFGHQFDFQRRTHHPCLKRTDYFQRVPYFENRRMMRIRSPYCYNVNCDRKNVKNNNAFKSSQLYSYTPVIINKNSYLAPFYVSPVRDYNNDLKPKSSDFLNNKMSRLFDEDRLQIHPEENILNESITDQPTSVLDICKMVNETKTEKPLNGLLLPSRIIIDSLGPWVLKSEREVMSKNAGALSMLYGTDVKSETIIQNAGSLIEGTSENNFKYEISLVNENKCLNGSNDEIKDILNYDNVIQEPCLSENTTSPNMVIWEEPTLNLKSIADSTCSDIEFDLKDEPIFDECSQYISNMTLSTVFQPKEIAMSTTTAKLEEYFDEYPMEDLVMLKKCLETKLPTVKVTTKKYNQKIKHFSKRAKFKTKNLLNTNKNCLKSSFVNIKNNIGDHLGKRKHDSFKQASYSEIEKIKSLYGKEFTIKPSYLDDIVTFNFDDYVCQCHRTKKTTNKFTHLRKNLDSRKLSNLERKSKSDISKISDCAVEDYEEIGSCSRPVPESAESFQNNFNLDVYSNMVDKCGNNTFPKSHGAGRTKRNTNKWFRVFPRRKRKREFVSSNDSSNNYGNSRVRLKRLHSVNINHTSKQNKDVQRHSPQNNVKHSMNVIKRVFTGKSAVLKHHKVPKDNKKREFVSCLGYGNDSCTTNSPFESTLMSTTSFTESTEELTEVSTDYYEISSTPTEKMSTTKPLRLVPDTGNRHPSKMACEELYHVECICYTESAVVDLNNIVSGKSEAKILLKELSYYNCTDYRPVKAIYSLSSDLKPRLITKKHKEMLPDDKKGPKEISMDTFQALLARGIPNEGVDFYIFPGSSIQVPCFSHNDILLSSNIADSTKYDWQHDNEKSITEGRVIEDVNHKGTLQINDATGVDAGNYTCTVRYINPDTEEEIRNAFVHSVKVVILPKIALHTLLHYAAPVKCEQETLEMFELYIPQQVEELICKCENLGTQICSMEIHNPLCHGKNIQVMREGPRLLSQQRTRWLRQLGVTSEENEESKMELSLNYELDMVDVGKVLSAAVNKTRCDPFCQLKVLLKFVEILRDSLVVALSHSVNSSVGVVFEPDISTLNVKLLIACEGGLKLCQGFCIPCPVNTYSEEGSTECTACPKGTYQPRLGSKSCEECPHPFEHGCSALWSSPKVIGILILVILIALAIIVLVMYLCFRMISGKNSKKKDRLLESDHTPRRVTWKRKAMRKKRRTSSQNRYLEDSSEGPPTLPSEDFTG